jgi:hypothetical protein
MKISYNWLPGIEALKSGCFAACNGIRLVMIPLLVLALGVVAERAGPAGAAEKTGGVTFRGRVPETAKFYCGERIVAPGDSRAAVVEKCGQPAWKEVGEDTVTEALLPNRTPVNLMTTEEWVYNFGSRDLLHFLRFQGDRLAVIETGGYGYDDPTFGQDCADGKNVSLGDSKYDVMVKCGAPLESGQFGIDAGRQGDLPLLDNNTWSYNFGPGRFVYTFTFRKGRVTDIRTGGYGH